MNDFRTMRENYGRSQAHDHWLHARREAMLQDLVCSLKECSVDLLSFDEVKTRLHLTEKIYRGVEAIEIDKIRGSVGRYQDFQQAFLPKKSHLRERWESVDAFASTHEPPPIEVNQVGEAYFVLDGNHRVSTARQQGRVTFDAQVWEYKTPIPLSGEADHDELLIKAEQLNFLEHTQLDSLRPNHGIRFTAPGGYHALECQFEIYHQGLEEARGEQITKEQAIGQWYDELYAPGVASIRESKVMEQFPERSEADLFIWVWKNQENLIDFSAYDLQDAFSGKRRLGGESLVMGIKRSLGELLARLFLKSR